MYGSNLWDLFRNQCERLYTSYSVAMRSALDIDRCTHRYLVEPLSQSLHLKTMLLSRYVTFYESLIESNKMPVRFLARLNGHDNETVLGRNLANLAQMCSVKISELSSNMIKRKVMYRATPDNEKWRVNMALELISARDSTIEVQGFKENELETMLSYICTM